MIVFLLILHGLLAVALLGAITHQAISAWAPANRASVGTFIGRMRAVPATSYVNAVIVLYALKEHFVALGLGMLPAYWYFWRAAHAAEYARTRALLTALLAFIVWWGFL